MIYVTHDQIEAMTLGQRIVVLNDGEIQQIDVPMKLYEEPANIFVAGFLGSPAMNFLRGTLRNANGRSQLHIDNATVLPLGDLQRLRPELARCIDKEIVLGLRPEHLHVVDAAPACEPDLRAQLEVVEPVGNEAFLNLRFGSNELVARVPPQTLPAHGAQVSMSFDPRNLHAFDPQSTRRIAHVD